MLVSKDEPLRDSMVNVGYEVLRCLEASDQERVSMVDLYQALRKARITDYRSISFGLIFLHTAGAIDFNAPYICRLNPAHS